MKTYITKIDGLIKALDSLLESTPDYLKPLVTATKLNPEQASAYNQYVRSADPSAGPSMIVFNSSILHLNDRLIHAREALQLLWDECHEHLLHLAPSTNLAALHIRRAVLLKHALLILQDFATGVREELSKGCRIFYPIFKEDLAQSIEALANEVLQAAKEPPTYQDAEQSVRGRKSLSFFGKKKAKAGPAVYQFKLEELPSYAENPPSYAEANSTVAQSGLPLDEEREDDNEELISTATL